jgi:hypothetical protein
VADKFIQKANESMERRGTKGSFTRAAKSAGKSVGEYASEHAGDSGALGKKARFAKAMRSIARKHKRNTGRGGRR